ncbi:hypothetical protein [Aestuariivirga sp.]|uniref:hypothetical protein n=1 Tax=Aestuariivirga sp. TaxID=2650926 RepID=UPI0039E4FE58
MVKADGTPLRINKDDESRCLLFDARDMAVFEIDHYGAISLLMDAPLAYGSGREHAMGAMLAGASASEAVAISARLDVWTGLPVMRYRRSADGLWADTPLTGPLHGG